jgi:uncharacterized protein YjiS (DUF1127 family)
MSDIVHNGTTLLAGGGARETGFAPALRRLGRWLGAPVRAYFQRELVLRELHSLGDRDLADIGLTRSDIPSIVAGLHRRGGLAQPKLDPEA